MFAEIGDSHPGYDCFVFKREIIHKFVFNSTSIGANWIGRIFYANLVVYSEHLEIIKDVHLTFHIGEEGAWLNHNNSEFDEHNKLEVYNSIHQLMAITTDISKLKALEQVLNFMDNWGAEPIISRIKLANKIKRYLLRLFS
jgi:hypothetical protein